jgi:cation transport regulator
MLEKTHLGSEKRGVHMPGKDESIEDLPENVKNVLPEHAQEIYLAAHNNALEQYKDPEKRRGDASLEETAHKVAWAAVEQKYKKNEKGQWVRKEE